MQPSEKGIKHIFLRLGWYRRRWRVENFFRVDPRGCDKGGLATRQLRSIRTGPSRLFGDFGGFAISGIILTSLL
jgi:hypothetical protein